MTFCVRLTFDLSEAASSQSLTQSVLTYPDWRFSMSRTWTRMATTTTSSRRWARSTWRSTSRSTGAVSCSACASTRTLSWSVRRRDGFCWIRIAVWHLIVDVEIRGNGLPSTERERETSCYEWFEGLRWELIWWIDRLIWMGEDRWRWIEWRKESKKKEIGNWILKTSLLMDWMSIWG